jgi:hypothetical protein
MNAGIMTARVVSDARKVVDVWTANPTLSLGELSKESLVQAVDALETAHAVVETKRTELTALINDRDSKSEALTQLLSRVRSGIRAVFGPDSSQYEQAGGVRASERQVRRSSNNGAQVVQASTSTK